MKNERQNRILKIIAEYSVQTQEELLEHLKEYGFHCTQATISRDIKDLHINKQSLSSGGYRYAVSQEQKHMNVEEKLRTIFHESVVSVDCAGNIVVLKTMPGLAGAACAAVDSMAMSFVVGSIAGDDTVFLVIRSEKSAEEFVGEIRDML